MRVYRLIDLITIWICVKIENCRVSNVLYKVWKFTNKEVPEGDNRNREVCISCRYIHYENPKIVVGVLPILNDNILLCKRDIDPGFGRWTVPSGFAELMSLLKMAHES